MSIVVWFCSILGHSFVIYRMLRGKYSQSVSPHLSVFFRLVWLVVHLCVKTCISPSYSSSAGSQQDSQSSEDHPAEQCAIHLYVLQMERRRSLLMPPSEQFPPEPFHRIVSFLVSLSYLRALMATHTLFSSADRKILAEFPLRHTHTRFWLGIQASSSSSFQPACCPAHRLMQRVIRDGH